MIQLLRISLRWKLSARYLMCAPLWHHHNTTNFLDLGVVRRADSIHVAGNLLVKKQTIINTPPTTASISGKRNSYVQNFFLHESTYASLIFSLTSNGKAIFITTIAHKICETCTRKLGWGKCNDPYVLINKNVRPSPKKDWLLGGISVGDMVENNPTWECDVIEV